jgi:predicted cobalt transporter CbtA
MEAKILNTIGLVLNIIGCGLWFFYGFPQPTHEQGVGVGLEDGTKLSDGRTVAQHNDEVWQTRDKYLRMSNAALVLIAIGFVCQLIAVWI